MITPSFSCTQDDDSIILSVQTPSIRATDVDIHIEGRTFTLHINPYFLRLSFPSDIVENDESSAVYDPSTGYLEIKLTKAVKGEVFEGLDLLSKLLAPSRLAEGLRSGNKDFLGATRQLNNGTVLPPMIETINEATALSDGLAQKARGLKIDFDLQKERDVFLEAEANDWRHPQKLPPDLPHLNLLSTSPYGFLNAYSGYFRSGQLGENDVLELGKDVERLTLLERRERRQTREAEKWDEEYYIADFMNDADIQAIISWTSPFDISSPGNEAFSYQENKTMLTLPHKEYFIPPPEHHALYITLVQILFAFAYDLRTTQGDPTPESGWTICSLTPCFAALDTTVSSSIHEVFTSAYTRALCFPLYRNWELCERCQGDVADILCGGVRAVSKALLTVKGLLDRHQAYYVYSKIWVDDYIVWTQVYASDANFRNLSDSVRALKLERSHLSLPLEVLELAAESVQIDSDDEDVVAV